MSNELPDGRELDALIARTIIIPGTHWDWPGWAEGYMSRPDTHYSTDIAAAWQVVEKLWQDKKLRLQLTQDKISIQDWRAEFLGAESYTSAETAPLAICRAALAALEGGPQ